MHENCVAATVRDLARNVIVEGVLEAPQPQLDLDGLCAGPLAWRGLATSAASPVARPRSI